MSKSLLLRPEATTTPRIDSTWFLDYFGGDSVTEIYDGNSRIARGAFGELSLAMYELPEKENNDKDSNNNNNNNKETEKRQRPRQVVAVKTLFQSTFSKPKGRGGAWGSVSRQSPPDKPKTLSREVFYEICALRLLSPHANIVPLLAMYPSRGDANDDGGGLTAGTSLSFAFEYAPMDLHLAMEWRKRTFRPLLSFAVVRTIARDVLSALQHCHSHGVIHRDVKCGNLLVSSTGMIQLCDFGLAKPSDTLFLAELCQHKQKQERQESDTTSSCNGTTTSTSRGHLLPPVLDPQQQESSPHGGLCTLPYRPPEVLLGGAATHSSVDVYSAGIVVAELLLGGARHLFAGTSVVDQLVRVFDALGTPSETRWPGACALPDYGKLLFTDKEPKLWIDLVPRTVECSNLPEFLATCIALDPELRWSCSALLEHAWLVPSRDNSACFFADRQTLIKELVPDDLDEPVLLAGTDASRTILSLASRRRTFLSKLVEQFRSTIVAKCH